MRAALLLLALAAPAGAETVVAARTIRPATLIAPEDLALTEARTPGALTEITQAVGREARVALYAGRPVRAADLGAPTVVDRNQIVPLAYMAGPLEIRAEGRALSRGGIGDVIRVMNMNSRATVFGRIAADGSVRVGPDS